MTHRKHIHVFHGGHRGAEAEFGRAAEAWGLKETTLSFEGHKMARLRNVRVLSDAELEAGRVSMDFVFQRMGRRFATGNGIRRVIHSMFHLVVHSDELFAVGWIHEDGTVKGGTGWGVELAKLFNRRVHVFDQEQEAWFTWADNAWQRSQPELTGSTVSATGTRNLTPAGERAIHDLFQRSLGERQSVDASVEQSAN